MAKDIDLRPDMDFQERDWRAERIAWLLMLLFVLSGLMGLFGRGGVSDTTATSQDGKMKIKYQRFLRYHTGDKLEVTLNNITGNSFTIIINKEFIDKVQVESINPQPEKVLLTKEGSSFIFNTENNLQQAKVMFYIHPEKLGSMDTEIKDNTGSMLRFNQFIYP